MNNREEPIRAHLTPHLDYNFSRLEIFAKAQSKITPPNLDFSTHYANRPAATPRVKKLNSRSKAFHTNRRFTSSNSEATHIDVMLLPAAGGIRISDPDKRRREYTARNLNTIVSGLNGSFEDLHIHVDAEADMRTTARGTTGHLEGNCIFLNPRRYQADTTLGRRILAHEIVHVAQRRRTPFSEIPRNLLAIASEWEASNIANAFADGRSFQPPVLPLPAGSTPAFTVALIADLKEAFINAIILKTGVRPPKPVMEIMARGKEFSTWVINSIGAEKAKVEEYAFGISAEVIKKFIGNRFDLIIPDAKNGKTYVNAHLYAVPSFEHLEVGGSFELGFWGKTITVGQTTGEELHIYIPWTSDKKPHGTLPPAIFSNNGKMWLRTGPGEFNPETIELKFIDLGLPQISDAVKWDPSSPILRAESVVFDSGFGLSFDSIGLSGENGPSSFSLKLGNWLSVEHLELALKQDKESAGPNQDINQGMLLHFTAKSIKVKIPGEKELFSISRPELVYDYQKGNFKLSASSTNEFKLFGIPVTLTDIFFEAGPENIQGGFALQSGRKEGPFAMLGFNTQGITLQNLHMEWNLQFDTLKLDVDYIKIGRINQLGCFVLKTSQGSVIVSDFTFPNLPSFFNQLLWGEIKPPSVDYSLPAVVDFALPGNWEAFTWLSDVPRLRADDVAFSSTGIKIGKLRLSNTENAAFTIKELLTVRGLTLGVHNILPDDNITEGISFTLSADQTIFNLPGVSDEFSLLNPSLVYNYNYDFIRFSTDFESFKLLGKTVRPLPRVTFECSSNGITGTFTLNTEILSFVASFTHAGVFLKNYSLETDLGKLYIEHLQVWNQLKNFGKITVSPKWIDYDYDISGIDPSNFKKLLEGIKNTSIESFKKIIDSLDSSKNEIDHPEQKEKKDDVLSENQITTAKKWYARNTLRYPPSVVIDVQSKLGIKLDGIFNSSTIQAIAEWQKEGYLDVDGIAGSATLVKMFGRDIRSDVEGDHQPEIKPKVYPQIDESDASFMARVFAHIEKHILFPDPAQAHITAKPPEITSPKLPEKDEKILRNPPEKRKYKIIEPKKFKRKLDGRPLKPSLVQQIDKMANFAIENDLVKGDIKYNDGMRSPKRAHRWSTSWSIRNDLVPEKNLKALGEKGKDEDGTQWFNLGWTTKEIKDNAIKKGLKRNTQAAEGYQEGNSHKKPNTFKGVSRHTTGCAMDVSIPWITSNKIREQKEFDVLKSKIRKKYKKKPKMRKKQLSEVDRFVKRGSYSGLAEDIVKVFKLRRPLLHSISTEDWHYELERDFRPGHIENEKQERQEADKVASEYRGTRESKTPEAPKTRLDLPADPKKSDVIIRRFALYFGSSETYFSLDEEGLGRHLAKLRSNPELILAVFDLLQADDYFQVFQAMQKALEEHQLEPAPQLVNKLQREKLTEGMNNAAPRTKVRKHSAESQAKNIIIERGGRKPPHFFQGAKSHGSRKLGKSSSIKRKGCAISSIAMVLAYFGRDMDPGRLDAYLDKNNGYKGNNVKWDIAFKAGEHKGLPTIKRTNHEFTATDQFDEILNDRIQKNWPTLAHIDYGDDKGAEGDHWVVVVGKSRDGHFIINDPGISKGNGAENPNQNVTKLGVSRRKKGLNLVRLCLFDIS